MKFTTLIAVLLIATTAGARSAQPAGESLPVTLPPGYKIDFRTQRGNLVMTEMVPTGETVDNWTEMVTVQVFHGLKAAPQKFRETLQRNWIAACPGGSGAEITSTAENGYPVLLWLLDCPRNPGTGKPELTWFKAIAGSDSFYVVQKAFKFEPTKAQVTHWMGYLRSIAVCDSRLAAHACAQTGK